MPGLVAHAELPRYYADAGCFVHPAAAEPWGLVVNEAMASGLPVLVSESAGCSEDLVSSGANGFAFEADDAPGLSDLMLRISSGDVDRASMGRSSRRIIADWGLTTFARQLYRAWEAGSGRSKRFYPLQTRLVLTALRVAARNVHSFHAIRE
jgi:glycosyltransferase involved in cell wall biosynthesis